MTTAQPALLIMAPLCHPLELTTRSWKLRCGGTGACTRRRDQRGRVIGRQPQTNELIEIATMQRALVGGRVVPGMGRRLLK